MFQLRIFVLLVIYGHYSSCSIQSLYDTGKELFKLYSILDGITLNTTEDVSRINDIFLGLDDTSQRTKNQMSKIHGELDRIDKSIHPKFIQYSFKFLPAEIILYKSIDTIELFVSTIDEFYKQFHQYTNGSSYFSNLPLHDLLYKLELNLEGCLRMIRHIMTENSDLPNNGNLIDAITHYAIKSKAETCNGAVISSALVKLFKMTLIAEIKVNMMSAFVNLFQYTSNEGWKILNSDARDRFKGRFEIYANSFASNLKKTDTLYLRECDPEDGIWIRGESFFELEGTFQTTIFRHHWARCKFASCNEVLFIKQEQCGPSIYDVRSSCSTVNAECAYLSAVEACVLKRGPYKFQYVNSTELGLLGNNFTCPEDNGYMIKDGTGWDSIFATCACNCYGNHNKISLSIVTSMVEDNMVIIGVRFIRQDNVLYIQVREGKLSADGQVIQSSMKWTRIYGTYDSQSINKENKVFFLDDLRLPANYALTGIKFNKVKRGTVTGFAIEIFGHPFDYQSGKLSSQMNHRISKKALNVGPRTPVSYTRISSINTFSRHKPTPGPMKYISLERSTLRDDFGQSTLPLFDAVPVTTAPSILGGLGIFHKGVEGYAGFISLRVYGIQYSKYFSDFIDRKKEKQLFATSHILMDNIYNNSDIFP